MIEQVRYLLVRWSVPLASLTLVGFLADPLGAQPLFDDVTSSAGVGTEYYRGRSNHALGVVWIDFNEDGWPDLFASNGKFQVPHLYQNDQDGTFTLVDELLPALPDVEMMGATAADYDNDGDTDLYVFTDNQQKGGNPNPPDGPPNILLKNMFVENGMQVIPGQPLFVDVAPQAGLDDLATPPFGPYPAYRAPTGGWLDYDRDGDVDLYVAHWRCQFGGEETNLDDLYRNNGDGTFTKVTASAGLHDGSDPKYLRPALAFLAAHLDGDLWPDIYVANVQMPSPHHHDIHYRNNGDGTFEDITARSPGVGDDAGAAMGIDTADIDLDGDWDLYLSDLYDPGNDSPPLGNPLYINKGDGTFEDNSAPTAGVVGGNSWAVNFFDADQDGWVDLFVGRMGDTVANHLYVNNGDGTFTDEALSSGIGASGNARGAAVADYDRDGLLDLAVIHQSGYLVLFRNITPNAGDGLQVRLTGIRSNRDAIGTLVKARVGGVTHMRQVVSTSSAHSQGERVLHFGLGAAAVVDELEIFWPSGEVNSYESLSTGQLLDLEERFVSTMGVLRTDLGQLFLKHSHVSGPADLSTGLGMGGESWNPMAGDWNGDTRQSIGVWDEDAGQFLLWNSNAGGAPDIVATPSGVGPGALPIAGDWDGDGIDSPGLFDVDSGRFLLWNGIGDDSADLVIPVAPSALPGPGARPVAGDWNGDGVDSIGLYDATTSLFVLRDANIRAAWDYSFRVPPRGTSRLPVAGDWNHDGFDTVGLYDPVDGKMYLKSTLANGPSDAVFRFAEPGSGGLPVAGAWERLD